MRKANILVSVLCILLSAYVIKTAQGFPENLSAVDPGPAYFPTLMAGMVIILTGAGEKSFVAGADIASMSTMTKAEGEAFGKLGNDIFLMIEKFPVPVIAAVSVATAVIIYIIFAVLLGAKLPAGLLKGIL